MSVKSAEICAMSALLNCYTSYEYCTQNHFLYFITWGNRNFLLCIQYKPNRYVL